MPLQHVGAREKQSWDTVEIPRANAVQLLTVQETFVDILDSRRAAKVRGKRQIMVVGYSVQLDAWFRRDGREWLVWCPAIDVITQARTKKRALESLREAVELWYRLRSERNHRLLRA